MKSVSWPCIAVFSLWTIVALGDSWAPPKEFEALCANGKFVARIVPVTGATNAHAVVYAVRASGRWELWRAQLSNRVSPSRAFLADDGSALVTTDSWGGLGYGDDVVAIYSSKGLLGKYGLEQFAPPPAPKKRPKENDIVTVSIDDDEPYRQKFTHSTSSRHWRAYSRQLFVRDDGRLLFCIWLDWDERWVAWNMADGSITSLTPRQIQRFNLLERDKALHEITSKKAAVDAYNFLGRTKFNEDRPLIEEWLRDATFAGGSIQRSSSNNPEVSFTYTSRSHKREDADRILARWDGIRDNRYGSHEDYFFLGTVRGQVHLRPQTQTKGILRIYLIPSEFPLQSWAERQPQQFLTADLAHGPYRFENGKHFNIDVGEKVNFMIYGVTPGKYRVKAVWDRAAPFCDQKDVMCVPGAGDHVSMSSSLFEVKKGAVTEGLRVDCTQAVK